jgi:hypothetical protein
MKFKSIIQLAFCFLSLTGLLYGQDPSIKTVKSPELRKLPKLTDGNLHGKIRERALQNVCQKTIDCDCEEFLVKKFKPSVHLPSVKVYSIENKRSFHWFEFFLQYKDKSYSSLEKADFERFLKDYKILSKPNLLNIFLEIYEYFKMDTNAIHSFVIVSEGYLKEYSDNLRKYETGFEKLEYQSIHPPQLKRHSDGSVEIEFYANNSLDRKIMKIQAIISSDYRFQEKKVFYRQEKPIIID